MVQLKLTGTLPVYTIHYFQVKHCSSSTSLEQYSNISTMLTSCKDETHKLPTATGLLCLTWRLWWLCWCCECWVQVTVTKVTIITASNHKPFLYTYVGGIKTPQWEAGWKENTLMKTPRQKQCHVSRSLLLSTILCSWRKWKMSGQLLSSINHREIERKLYCCS